MKDCDWLGNPIKERKTMTEDSRDMIDRARKDKRLQESIKRTLAEHGELLAKLDDYKDGIPYWEEQIHD